MTLVKVNVGRAELGSPCLSCCKVLPVAILSVILSSYPAPNELMPRIFDYGENSSVRKKKTNEAVGRFLRLYKKFPSFCNILKNAGLTSCAVKNKANFNTLCCLKRHQWDMSATSNVLASRLPLVIKERSLSRCSHSKHSQSIALTF